MYDKIRVTVGGDPEGGWLVDIHDGENSQVYNPAGKTADDAVASALKDHREAFKNASKEDDYVPADAAQAEADETTSADEGAAPAPVASTEPAPTSAA